MYLTETTPDTRREINQNHIQKGVNIIDPQNTYITDSVKIAPGAVIYPGVILEGETTIAQGAVIIGNSHLTNATIEAGAVIQHSVIADSKVGEGTTVGPFAYLRMQANIGPNCRIGDFVEVKNANLDAGVKMAHLAYIGDADIGKNVNYSCGAITANYDGKKKHRTTVGDNAFIGSNSNLIAPVTIGEGAFVAAGSTITADLASGSLGIARARQVEKPGWNKE